MPTVPRAQRQVQDGILPSARVTQRASDEAFGGGGRQVLEAATRATGQIAKVMEQEREKALSLEASNYDREFKKAYDRKLYDPENGFMALKGRAPSEGQKQYIQDFESEIDAKIAEVSDERLKERLVQQKNNYISNFHSATERHAFQEIKEYDNTSTAANLTAAQEMALTNMYEPGRIGESVEKINRLVDEYGMRNGLPPEAITQKKREEVSKTYGSVITKMVNDGDDRTAKAFLKEIEGEIDGGTRDQLAKMIDNASIRGDSQRVADEIMQKGLSESEALAEARKIEDPKRRDEAVRRVKNRYSENKAIQERQAWEIADNAGKKLEEAGSLDVVPPAQWDKLNYKQQMALKKREQQLKAGVEPDTDFTKYYQLEQLAAEKRQAFGKINLIEFRPYLSDTDFKKFSKMQASYRQKTSEANSLFDGVESKNSIVNNALTEIGVDYSKKASDEEIQRSNKFRRRVDDLVMEKQRELGREVNNKELREIVDDLRVEVVTDKGWLWDTEKRIFELNPGDEVSMDFEDIPEAERAKIEQALVRAGITVSEEEITRKYAAMLSKRLGNGS